MKKSRFTDSQILGVLKQAEAGTPVPELCRTHGISSATFYKWRSKYGGMDASMISRMKALEEENRRLKKMYAEGEINPGIQIPIDGAGNTVSVDEFVQEFNSQTSEAIKTTPEFKETVRPAMVRVFEKRGIGMTDEQFLLYHFGVDLATKSITIFALRRQMSSIFDMLRDMSGTMPTPEPQPKAKAKPAPGK